MDRDTVQLETAVNTISQEYLLEFTSEYGIPEALHPELPWPEDRIVDFPEGKNNHFFWVDERVFPMVVDWRTSAPKDGMPAENTYFSEAMRILDTHHTPIQKQPEALLCLVGLSRRYYLGDEVYPTFLHDDMDLFSLIRAPNPTKVKTGSRPCVAHEVPLLTMTATRVIELEDPAAATDSENVAAAAPPAVKESRKRGNDGVDANAPPKVLRRDHADPRPTGSARGGKSLAAIELGMGSTRPTPVPPSAPADVSDPDPLSFADPQSRPPADVAQQYNINLARQVAMGSQLRLRFEQEAKLLKKSVARVTRRDKRIQAREHEIKNLEALLEAEADMKKAAKEKNVVSEGIAKGMSEGLKHGVEHGQAQLNLEAIEAYDPKAEAKYIAALQALKNLKYPLWVRDLRLGSSQLTIPVYPEVRDPLNPWACKEEMLLADAIAANVSRAEKKKKCRVVCRTHGVGFVHHAQSDGVLVSVPTVIPQGLAILLADAATHTESDEASQLPRSSSLPFMRS
nr:transposase (putative), gypsy type [Tanacetum cinerariifolium]